MSCTFADLQVVRYAEAMLAAMVDMGGLLTPGQEAKVGEIEGILGEIVAVGEITIDHELDCVKVALTEAVGRIVP